MIKKKKNLLIFTSNIFTTFLMLAVLIKKENKYFKINIVMESRNSDGKIKFSKSEQYITFMSKAFRLFGFRNIYIYDREKNFKIFNLKNLFHFFSIKKKNISSQNKLKNFFINNNINRDYSEAWFTNDLTSKIYLNINPNIKKTYFFHGLGDIMILKKKNIISNFFEKLKFTINNYFFNYFLITNNKHIKFIHLFSNYYNQFFFYKPDVIEIKNYKKIIKILSNRQRKIKFDKKIILITDNINLQKFKNREIKSHSKYYAEKLINHFKKKNCHNLNNFEFYLKWKRSIPNNHKKIFINEFKNYGVNLKDTDKHFKEFIPLEIVLMIFKPDYVVSNYSSINYVIKKIFPKIKIINTSNIHENFQNQYYEYHKKHNLLGLLKNSEKIKKLVPKIPFHERIKN